MRRDNLDLADIVEASDAIAGFISGTDEADFVGNDLVRSAVLQKLTVVGEAAARISDALTQQHPDVPLAGYCRFPKHRRSSILRHRLAHRLETPRRSTFLVCMKSF